MSSRIGPCLMVSYKRMEDKDVVLDMTFGKSMDGE